MTLKTITYESSIGPWASYIRHECPGLDECVDHPRWHVWEYQSEWVVAPPGEYDWRRDIAFPTFAQAIHQAQREARRPS